MIFGTSSATLSGKTSPMYKLLTVLLLFLLALPLSVHSQELKKSTKMQTIDGRRFYMHTVEKGQTLYQIARTYEVDVNDIILENPEAIDGIKPGQVLKIPASKPKQENTVALDTVNFLYHKVEQGQTVYAISRLYALTVESINSLNPGVQAGLKAGQLVKIPKTPATTEVYYRQPQHIKIASTVQQGQPKTGSPDTIPLLDSASAFRKVYNIAFCLPFRLETVDNIDIDKIVRDDKKFPQKSEVAIEFYQGARIALDSLKSKGMRVNAYFYDVDDRDSLATLDDILKRPEFNDMHLIIGPLYSSNFIKVSVFAKEKGIPIVSPFAQQNKMLFRNPYVSKPTPAVVTQLEEMGEYIVNKYGGENIILLSSKDTAFSNPVRKRIKALLAAKQIAPPDSLKEVKAVAGISPLISQTKNNIIIVPSNSRVYVTEVLSKLNNLAEKNNITVFGMPSWNSFDNLDLEYLNNVHFHYVTSQYVNYDDEDTKRFILAYRSEYKADPSEYVFQGYDVTSYYLGAMMKHGLNYPSMLEKIPGKGLQTSFEFFRVSPDSGYENKAIRVIGSVDYKQTLVN